MHFVGQDVFTPYGKGIIIRKRNNDIIVKPSNWYMASGQTPTFYLNPQDVKPVFKVGDKVSSTFGSGVINEIRQTDSVYVVTLDSWFLATGKSPVLYLQSQSFSLKIKSSSIPNLINDEKCVNNLVNEGTINQRLNPQDIKPTFKIGDEVRSIFGSGVINEIRQTDSIYVITLDNWFLATGKSPVLYLQSQSFSLKSNSNTYNNEKIFTKEASDEFPINSLVKTIFGVGIVKTKRQDTMLVVESTDWKLANNKNPIFYLQPSSVTKYTPITKKEESIEQIMEAKIIKLIAQAIASKNEGNASFKNKNLAEAKKNYLQALSFIQNLSDDIKKEQRASIFELMITCSNNIALCSLREKQYSDVTNHAKTSLNIIEAIEGRLDGKVWSALQKQGVTLSTLKKTWKRKCLYLLGKAEYSLQNYEEAKSYLQSALLLIEGDSKLQKDIEELKELIKDTKKHIREFSKREKKRWSAAFQKNTEDGKEEEKITNEIVKNSNLKIPPAASGSTNKAATATNKKKNSSSSSNTNNTVALPFWNYFNKYLSSSNFLLYGIGGITGLTLSALFFLNRSKK